MKRGILFMVLLISVMLIADNPLKPIENPIDNRVSYRSGAFELNREATLSESFESGLPADWTVINNDGGAFSWAQDATYAHSGSYSMSKMYESPSDDWLVSPQITLQENDVLTLWARSYMSYFAEHLTVWASTTNNSVESFTIQLAEDSAVAGEWTKYTIDFADFAEINTDDSIYLGFQCTSYDCYWLYLDDIEVAPLPTEPIITFNNNDVAFGEVEVFGSSEIANCITISNTGGGSLEFSAITDLAGVEFSSDFDIATTLEMDESYSFGFIYTPLNDGLDEIDFIIESNGGDPLTIHLSGTGYSLPAGMVEIGTGSDAFFLPTRSSQPYSYSQTILRQDEINMEGQQVEKLYYHYTGYSAMDLEADIYMGHTTQSEFGDIIPLSQLVQTFSGTINFPAEDCWVEIEMDNPFYYNNTDNLVVVFDDNTGVIFDEMNRFYSGMDIANTSYINWSNDDIDPASPSRFVYNYRPNIRLQLEEGQATPILSSDTQAIDFGIVNVGQTMTYDVTLSNIGAGILSLESYSGLDGSEFLTNLDLGTILGPGETYAFTVSYSPVEEGLEEAVISITSNGGDANISITGEGYQMPEGLIGIGDGEITGTHLPVECYYNYSLSETIYLQNEINMSGQRIREISYYYAGGSGWTDDAIQIYMGHTAQTELTDWITADDLNLVYDGTYSVPAEEGWVTITLTQPYVYNNTENLVVMFYENTPTWHSSSDQFYATSTTGNRSCYNYSDGTNPEPDMPPAATMSANIPNVRMQFEAIPVEPIMSINTESHDFGAMYEGAISEPLNVRISNMGGSDLTFSSVTDLTGTDFVTDFDIETVIASAGCYDFSFTYLPSDVNVDEIEITIISNGGEATISLSGEGVFAPQGEVVIGEETNIDTHLPVEPYYGYTLSESIYLQSEIVQANQRIEQIHYYYGGGAGWAGDEVQVLMGHTQLSELTDWIPANELTPVYTGPFDAPVEEGWITINFDVPFVYNNTDNLVILVDENTPGCHSSVDDFFGTNGSVNRSAYYYSDSNNPDLYNPPAANLSTYRANIKMTFFDIPTDPIINVSPELMAFPTVSAGQVIDMNMNISNGGGGELIISGIQTSAPFSCDWSGSILLGENVLVPVTFSPTEAGDFNGTLEISSNAINNSLAIVDLSGSACPAGTWFEGFESGLVPPEGWDITWQYGFELGTGSNAYEGAYSMAIDGTENSWLLSPLVEIENGSTFSFQYKAENLNDDTRLGLYIAPGYVNQNDLSFYEEMLFEVTVDDYENWSSYEYEFDGYEGLYYLAIRRTYTGDWGTYDKAFIDNLIMPPLHPQGITAAAPVFSHETGKYSEGFELTLNSETPGAEIYYTTDGSYPTTESILYNAPIDVEQSMIVWAIAAADGMDPSEKVRNSLVLTTPGDQVLREGFETWLSEDWLVYSVDGNDNNWQQYTGSGYISSFEGGHTAEIIQTADYNEDWLVTPTFMPTEEHHTVSFWATSACGGYFMDFMVKLSTNGNELFNFNTTLGDYDNLSREWRPFCFDLEDYIGLPVNLAIIADSHNQFRFFVDDFEGPELFYYTYDLQFESMDIADVLYEGITNSFSVTVRNCGANDATDYSIDIYANDEPVANFAGEFVAADATITANYQWIPEISGAYDLYAQINMPEDENSSNNLSNTVSALILPEGTETMQIGDGNILEYIPINYSWEYTLSQMLYLSEEINMAGYISGISFTSNFMEYTENVPVKVWIGETAADNLEDWVPTGNLEMVFDGYMTSEIGMQNYLIPFTSEYQYSGGNLVVMVTNTMGTNLYGQHQFVCTETGQPNRTKLTVHPYANINPEDPASGMMDYDFSLIPNLELFYRLGEIGSVEGYITANTVPVEGAFVELTDTYYQTITDASGYYNMPMVFGGDYEITVNKHGFSSDTSDITITADEVLDFSSDLIAYDQFSFSSQLILSDTQIPAAGVEIYLSGYDDYYETVTDANGDFLISDIFGEHNYQYEIIYNEYYSILSGSFFLTEDHDMETLILNEIANRPLNAHFEVDHDENGYLSWNPPYPEVVPDMCEGFEGGEIPAGWEVVQTCQVASTTPGWWTVNSQILEPDLIPTGDYHAGLWWVNGDVQDEWLITPEFFVPPTGFLQFDSYCWEGDYGDLGDHCYVKISTDNGETWDIVWDNALLTADNWNPYDHAYNIDLSAYANQDVKAAFHADGNGDTIPFIWFIDNVVFGSDIRFTENASGFAAADQNYSFVSDNALNSIPQLSVNGETHPATLNGRNFENSYDIYRIRWENFDDPDLWELVQENYTDTIYIDETWQSYPWGEYLFGVKANYSNGVQSVASISNHQQVDMFTDSNIQLTSNIEVIPENAELILNRQNPDPLGNEVTYETISDENGQVALTDVRKGYYAINVVAMGFEEALFTDVFIEDNSTIILEMEEKLIPPLNVTAEIDPFLNNVSLEWTVPDAGIPTEFRFDDGVINTGLGLGQPTENAAFAACFNNHAVIENLKWFLGGNNSVRIIVMGLDQNSMPNQNDLLFDTGIIPNIPNQWNEFELTQIIEAPTGFAVAIMTPFVFQNLGIDDGLDEPYVFQYGRQWICLDVFSGTNDWVSDDGSHPKNWMIRAGGLNIEDLRTAPQSQRYASIETVTEDICLFANDAREEISQYSNNQQTLTREFESFDIWRLTAGNEANPDTWTALNTEPVTDLNYLDDTWNVVEPGNYRYAVTANYAFGVSNPGFSNMLTIEVWGTLTGVVTSELTGEVISDARIVADEQEVLTNEAGEYALLLNPGTWEVQCYADGYNRAEDNVDIMADLTTDHNFALNEQLAVPYNLNAEITSYHDASLIWDAPVFGGGDSGWIKWDTGVNVDGIGTGNPAEIEAAIRFDENDIAPYAGGLLTRIKIYPCEVDCDYTLVVWGYGATEVLYEQPLSTVIANSWNEITLTAPIYLDGGEIWIGYRANTNTGYPIGAGQGPMVLNKGAWIRMNGGEWSQLTNMNASLNYNWNIQGFVLPTDSRTLTFDGASDEVLYSETSNLIGSANAGEVTISHSGYTMNRDFLGYNVYRNEEVIATVQELNYVDENLMSGDYNYKVTAQYSSGESNFSNVANINIEIGEFPLNLTYDIDQYEISLQWLSPENTTGLTGYYIYRNEVRINDDVLTETDFIDTVPYPLDYEYFVTSVYEYGESLPSLPVNISIYDLLCYGDIDGDWSAEAYDGALILQYVVGYDPMPGIDPLPWDEWRVLQADVDGNDYLGAYDAALILQFTVGIITEFPVVNMNRMSAPSADVSISVMNGNLIFAAVGELYAFTMETRFTDMGTPEAANNSLTALNNDGELFAYAMASATDLTQLDHFLSIPVNSIPELDVDISVMINNAQTVITVERELFTETGIPTATALVGNYPNPFNPSTTISFTLAETCAVKLEVFDIKGRKVCELLSDTRDAGFYEVIWNGESLTSSQAASAVYFYRLTAGSEVFTSKMLLLK